MVEAICASCSWPVQPGDAFCPRCGHALAASPADDARRQPARETAARAAAAAREAAARASSAPQWPAQAEAVSPPVQAVEPAVDDPVVSPAGPADPTLAGEPAGGDASDEFAHAEPDQPEPAPDRPVVDERHPLIAALLAGSPAPAADPPAQPGSIDYLSPSASHRTLSSIGGGRPSPGTEAVPESPSWPNSFATPALEDPTPASPAPFSPVEPAPIPTIPQRAAAAAAMVGTDALTSRQPAIADSTKAPLPGPAGSRLLNASLPAGSERRSLVIQLFSNLQRLWEGLTDATPIELLITGLTAFGGALVLIAFFLPWSGANGIGIGTQATADNPAPAYAWGFGSPAGLPLFLIFIALGALILASDKLRELMPRFSVPIRQLTDVALPIFLGAVMLTVSFLYLTLPWGCGQGPSILGLGGALFIVAGLVGLYRPAEAETEIPS